MRLIARVGRLLAVVLSALPAACGAGPEPQLTAVGATSGRDRPAPPPTAAEPPRITYPASRTSTRLVTTPGGVGVPVDRGLEWHGKTVYLAITSNLVAVDARTDRTLWAEDVSPFWRRMTFTEVEPEPGRKIWAVELRADEEEDAGQNLVEYRDLATGKKLDLPGLTPPPLGDRLEIRQWTASAAVAQSFHALVTTPENYDRLWRRLYGPDDEVVEKYDLDDLFIQYPPQPDSGLAYAIDEPQPPPVDFAREVVVVYCTGDTANTDAIRAVEVWEDDRRILVRTLTDGHQTFNRCDFSRLYAMFVLPRRADKAYVLEHDEQHYINGPPVWKERFRVDRLGDPAHELDALPAPAPPRPPRLPPGFPRDVRHAVERAGKLGFGNGTCEFDCYLDADGRRIFHGPFRKLKEDLNRLPFLNNREGAQAPAPPPENTPPPLVEFSGAYVDDKEDGVWTHWARPWQEWDNRHPHYTETWRQGVRDGPFRVFHKDGTVKTSGTFQEGEADGLWMDYHPNGKPAHERTFDRGLRDGKSTTYDKAGNKESEHHYRKGRLDGPCARWYANGQVALTGGFIAPDDSVPKPAGFPSIAAPSLHGLRHGEWVFHAPDGRELWRGAYDRGTGAVAEFHDNGSRRIVAQLAGGFPVGEVRVWHRDGWLETAERLGEDGATDVVTYHPNGVKRSETAWRRAPPELRIERFFREAKRQRHGWERHWDRDGNLEAECEWRDGHAWRGDWLTEYNGEIRRYANGRPTKDPRRYSQEAREKQALAKKIEERRARRGIKTGYSNPFPYVTEEDEEADRAAEALIEKLRSGPEAARAAAADALAGMGPAAVPALTARLFDRDLALGAELRKVLARIVGQPGPAEDGLAISAVAAGPRPQPGEAIPVWLTLTNVGDEPLCTIHGLWTLEAVHPGGIGPCIIFTGGPDLRWERPDYLHLAQGESWSVLMDADPGTHENPACAALNISRPPDAVPSAPARLHAMQQNMFSGGFTMRFQNDAPDPEYATEALRLGDRAGAGDAEAVLTKAGAAAIPALRLGLRAREHWARWAAFDFICRHPHADLEDDVVAYWGRLANGWTTGDPAERLRRFAAGLPPERRLPFFERIVAASPQDFRTIVGITCKLTGGTPEEKAYAVRFDTGLYERGWREHTHLNFLAWERARGATAELRDLPLALRLARECVALKPDYANGWAMLAVALSDNGKAEEARAAAERARALKPSEAFERALAGLEGKTAPVPKGKPEGDPE